MNSDDLDRESYAIYTLLVRASDMGSPSLWTETNVTVVLTDFNDVIPFFHEDSYSVSVSELVGVGTTILSLLLNDGDLGINKVMSYEIESDGEDAKYDLEID